MGSNWPPKKSNLWSNFVKQRLKETQRCYNSPMRPIILVTGVEMLSKPSMVSYREWEIRRSWLSSSELAGCSKTGGLPGASYRDRERDEE